MYRNRGFTLIELLIVVAIIAILAAIAVPNFLEAQTRAKVSRAKADQRSIATAIESYHVDWNKYPWVDGTEPSLEYRYRQITTPVAYMTSIPKDPFGDDVAVSIIPTGVYAVFDFVTSEHRPTELTFFERPGDDPPNDIRDIYGSSIQWYLGSQGPDLFPGLTTGVGSSYFTVYDPTNGTISEGDIFRAGPGGTVSGS